MDITPEERRGLVLKVAGFLDKAELPFCLTASTLLGIYRDGDPIGGVLEFDVLAKDINEDVINRINEQYTISRKRRAESGLSIIDVEGLYNNAFEIQLIYTTGKYAYKNLSGNECLAWPKYMYDTFDKFRWAGKEWNTPHDVENWFNVYYGKDWKTPCPGCGWHNAPNYCKLEDLKAGKVKFDIETIDTK